MNNYYHECMDKISWQRAIMYAFLGVAIGALLIALPFKYIVVTACGIIVLSVTVAKPEFGLLLMVLLICSIVFEESLPLIPIGVGSLHLTDVILLFMLLTLAYKVIMKSGHAFIRTPLDLPLVLFMAAVLVSVYLSIVQFGTDFNHVFRLLRAVSYYLIFFLVTNFIRDKKQVEFMIKGLFAIGLLVAVTMLAQVVIGESVQLMPGRIEAAETFGQEFEALRLLPPGQTLVFISFITAISVAVFRHGRSLWYSGYFYLVALLGVGVVLTYNRSYWVAGLLAFSLMFFLAGPENKKKLFFLFATFMVSAGLLVVLSAGTGGKFGKTLDALSERVSSLIAGKALTQSTSLDYRAIENRYAVKQIEKHPITGIGLGNDYRPEIPGLDDNLTYYVHNVYLWILADIGFPGFVFFFWFYIRFIVRAFKKWRRIPDNFLKSAVVGFLLSGIAILPMALVIPVFMEWFSIVIIAAMTGLTETILRISEMDLETT